MRLDGTHGLNVHSVNFTVHVHVVNMRRMRTPKPAYHHGDLRNALVSAAAAQLSREGVEQFSLREAARAVGVTANAAYRHFEDKAALLTAVAAAGFERLAQRMQHEMAAASGGPAARVARRRFEATGRAYVRFALDEPELFRVMFGPDGLRCLGTVVGPTPWALLGSAIDALVGAGLVAKRWRAGAELKAWVVVHGFASLALQGAAAAKPEALDDLLAFAVEGLTAPAQNRRGLGGFSGEGKKRRPPPV